MSTSLLESRDSNELHLNRGPKVVGIACGFLAASVVIGLTRLTLRAKRRLLSWDDLCIGIALTFSTMQSVAACISEHWGYGHPIKTLSAYQLQRALFWFYIAQISYKGAIWPAKISVLLLYNRVFGSSTHLVTSYGVQLRTSLVLLISFAITFCLISEIVTICTCIPIAHYWDKSVPGTCHVNTLAWWFTQSVLNTLSDIFILILPMPLIKDLQIPRQQKISLMLVFALGLFVTVCTIVRMTTFKTGAKGSDTTYDGAITLIWSLVETNVSITCACLPLLRPLISRIIPSFGKTKSRSKEKPNSGSYILRNIYDAATREKKKKRRGGQYGRDVGGLGMSDGSEMEASTGGGSRTGMVGKEESWEWKDGVTTVSTGFTNQCSHSDDSELDASLHGFIAVTETSPGRSMSAASGGDQAGKGGGGGSDRSGHPLGGITKQTDVEITTESGCLENIDTRAMFTKPGEDHRHHGYGGDAGWGFRTPSL